MKIVVYAPVRLPTAIALYAEGLGYDHTVFAAVLSMLVGLAVIAAARFLLAVALSEGPPLRC